MDPTTWKSPRIEFFAFAALLAAAVLHGDTAESNRSIYELTEFVIKERQTANLMPVTTYDTPVSNLEFNPRIDFQSRNMAEAQGDVTIRGGIFENTGFRVGSVTLIDPQTGHYFAEIPIAPEMLGVPEVLVAGDNALYGFNSTVGTISYGWTKISEGGSLTAGVGDHDLNFQRVYHAQTGQLGESGKWSWGAEVEYSRSESDGTISFGDHDFERTTGRVQIVGPHSQTDLFAGYQAKFFAWPGMYTAERFAGAGDATDVPETENLKTRLFILNHRQIYGDANFVEVTAMHRRHTDQYRLTPGFNFVADHETEVSSLGLSGYHEMIESFGLNYAAQFSADKIDSTDNFGGGLEQGEFQSRTYTKIALLPEYKLDLDNGDEFTLRAGSNFDDTNRNSAEVSFIGDFTWERGDQNGNSQALYLSYAETSQVAGYTAIGNSEISGIFRSNYDLDTETAKNLEIGGLIQQGTWTLEGAVFYRWDDDLTDWTIDFDGMGPFARSANPVDIETFGIELIAAKSWEDIEVMLSYAYLDKEEDYGDPTVDASFYALNYANHRATLGLIWRPVEMIKVSIDNEWRTQEENALRNNDDEAFFTHASVTAYPPQLEGVELFISVDNAWDDDFEEVPGTPGRGDQYALGMTYRW